MLPVISRIKSRISKCDINNFFSGFFTFFSGFYTLVLHFDIYIAKVSREECFSGNVQDDLR